MRPKRTWIFARCNIRERLSPRAALPVFWRLRVPFRQTPSVWLLCHPKTSRHFVKSVNPKKMAVSTALHCSCCSGGRYGSDRGRFLLYLPTAGRPHPLWACPHHFRREPIPAWSGIARPLYSTSTLPCDARHGPGRTTRCSTNLVSSRSRAQPRRYSFGHFHS